MTTIKVKWTKGRAKGFTDEIKLDRSNPIDSRVIEHGVVSRSGKREQALCRLSAAGPWVVLDYAAFPDPNIRRGMDLGLMMIRFEGDDPVEVWWRGERVDGDVGRNYVEVTAHR